jgi:SAM-dependent methyltransferase
MRCPSCREPLDADELSCPSGHEIEIADGVLRLLEPSFAARLDAFLDGFRRLRERDGRRIHDPSVFPRLPYAAELRHDPEWRTRGYDLQLIRRLVAARPTGTVLDIGAYNGWLSHRLALDGHRVTAVEYFVDEHDGIGAHRFYPTRWRAIQMDVRDLSVLDERFDLVVLNRCVQFAVEPPAMAAQAIERVADGGLLVITGLEFFADPILRRRGVEALAERLRHNGIEPFVPIKGYLDRGDERRFRSLGIQLRGYPQLRMRFARLRSRLDRRRGRPCFGVWPG